MDTFFAKIGKYFDLNKGIKPNTRLSTQKSKRNAKMINFGAKIIKKME